MKFELSARVQLVADLPELKLRAGEFGIVEEQRVGEYRVNFTQSAGSRARTAIVPSRLLRRPPNIERHPPSPAQSAVPRRIVPPGLRFAGFEGLFGAFFSFGVALLVVLCALSLPIVLITEAHHTFLGALAVIPAVLVIIEEIRFVYKVRCAIVAEKRSLPPYVAMSFSTANRFFGIARFVFFALHFAAALAAAVAQDTRITHSDYPLWGRAIGILVVTFTIMYSANMYALVALRCLGFGEAAINRAWRFRFLFDSLITIAVGLGSA